MRGRAAQAQVAGAKELSSRCCRTARRAWRCCATGPRLLEQQAAQLRQLARRVHQQAVLRRAEAGCCSGKEDDIDLLHAALLIARLDNEELDVDGLPAGSGAHGQADRGQACRRTPTTGDKLAALEQVPVRRSAASTAAGRTTTTAPTATCQRGASTTARACRSRCRCCTWSWPGGSA